jgi:hypothetical protein
MTKVLPVKVWSDDERNWGDSCVEVWVRTANNGSILVTNPDERQVIFCASLDATPKLLAQMSKILPTHENNKIFLSMDPKKVAKRLAQLLGNL